MWPLFLLLLGGGYYVSRVLPRILQRYEAQAAATPHIRRASQLIYTKFEHPFYPKMTREEALMILGFVEADGAAVNANPSAVEVQQRFKRLMLLHHSDRGGSALVTQKINEARDFLTK